MPRSPFLAGSHVIKGQETGRVVMRTSQRTGETYLTVQITGGPRTGQFEFPERGWVVDDGSATANDRPNESRECVASDDAFYRPFRQRAVNRACMDELREKV